MACSNCGASFKPGAKFCGSCGSQLTSITESNTSYPTLVGSSQSPLGLPPCQFKLIEKKGEGPDDDGDIRIELKYLVTNNTKQDWDYFAVTTQLVNFDGQVLEQSTDSIEQTLEPNDDTELDVYFGAANLKLLGQYPEKSIIVSTITACKAEFVSLGSIDIPTEAFQVVPIQPIKIGESAQLLSGSVYKTEPDSDKDCQVQVRTLIQNLTNLPLHEVKIIADVADKSGRELCDAGGYEQMKPNEISLLQGNGYTKEKSLKAAKVELSIRCYSPVAVSTIQTNGIDISQLPNIEDDEQNNRGSWPSPLDKNIDNENDEQDELESNLGSKRIYIKTEPGGRILFGKLDDLEMGLLQEAHENKEMSDDLLDLRFNSSGSMREYEGVINSGDEGDSGNEGIISIHEDGPIKIFKNESGDYEDGAYFVYLSLSKVSIEFTFKPNDGDFISNKFSEVSVPIELPEFIEHDLYGRPQFNIVTDYLYDGEIIEEYDHEIVDRGYDDLTSIFIVKKGQPKLINRN